MSATGRARTARRIVERSLNGLGRRVELGQNPFATNSDAYALSRPRYPSEIIEWIVGNCSGRDAAWDCATGNGQAAIALADHFDEVQATDVSAEQLDAAFPHPKVVYSVQAAESTNFPDASFDLITVAQALHWFDFDRFWPEVKRVAKPGALFCAWGYSWFEPDAELDRILMQPLIALLMPYFADQNRILWNGYRDTDMGFPFRRVASPAFSMHLDWSADQLLAYVRTWSAYHRAAADERLRLQLETIEAGARERFAGRGRLALEMRISIAAGRAL